MSSGYFKSFWKHVAFDETPGSVWWKSKLKSIYYNVNNSHLKSQAQYAAFSKTFCRNNDTRDHLNILNIIMNYCTVYQIYSIYKYI